MLLGFKSRFEQFVREGSKTHTIRADRARPFRAGETCHCYTRLRTKNRKLLGRWTCTKVERVRILVSGGCGTFRIWIQGIELERQEAELLAWKDGFRDKGVLSSIQMWQFWVREHGDTDFRGWIIHWDFNHPMPAPGKRNAALS